MKISSKNILAWSAAVVMISASLSSCQQQIDYKSIISSECPNADVIALEYPFYDTEVPTDFMGCGANGIDMKMPTDMTLSDITEEQVVYTNDTTTVFIMNKSKLSDSDYLPEPEDFDADSFYTKYTDIQPDSCYKAMKLMYTINTDCLDACTDKEATFFTKVARTKEDILLPCEQIYSFENKTVNGFIYDMGIEGDKHQFISEVFSVNDENMLYTVIVASSDDEQLKQITNSINIYN